MLGYDVLSVTKGAGSHPTLDCSKVSFTWWLLSQGDPDHTDSQADLYIYIYTLQSEIVFAWTEAMLGNQNNHGRPLGLSEESKSRRGLYRHVCRTLSLLCSPHASGKTYKVPPAGKPKGPFGPRHNHFASHLDGHTWYFLLFFFLCSFHHSSVKVQRQGLFLW